MFFVQTHNVAPSAKLDLLDLEKLMSWICPFDLLILAGIRKNLAPDLFHFAHTNSENIRKRTLRGLQKFEHFVADHVSVGNDAYISDSEAVLKTLHRLANGRHIGSVARHISQHNGIPSPSITTPTTICFRSER
ncbi:MAG: hypothetical protein QXH80_01495 [Candidatus Nanoarchaeia archaeon]